MEIGGILEHPLFSGLLESANCSRKDQMKIVWLGFNAQYHFVFAIGRSKKINNSLRPKIFFYNWRSIRVSTR